MIQTPWIVLVAGVPKVLHLADHIIYDKPIRDPETGFIKAVTTLTFLVDREDGVEIAKQWSILSPALAANFLPFIDQKRYRDWNFTVIESGGGYVKSWQVSQTPAS